MPQEMQRGAVRKLKTGYGFIAGDDGNDYFFHWTAMLRTSKDFTDLAIRERVEFTPLFFNESGEQKRRAIEICVIDDRPRA